MNILHLQHSIVHGAQRRTTSLQCRPGQAHITSQPQTRVFTQPAQQSSTVCHVYSRDENVEETEEDRIAKARAEVTRRIKQLGSSGRVKEAISTLAGLSKLGIQPDTPAATALVQACCRDMDLAQSIFDELFGDFLEPDEVSFAVLLRGYGARDPPDWQKIDATLTTMRMKHNLSPTATSFNALLEVCARTNDLDRGQDIIDRMAADGVEADEFTEEAVGRKKALRSYLRKVLLL